MTLTQLGSEPSRSEDQPRTTAPAFVVGSRRSGTTLVSRIIDAHPAFSIYHESFLLPIFAREVRWYGELRTATNLGRLIDDIREVLKTQIADVPSREDILAAINEPSLTGVFGALLLLYARRRGKRRGGDKTPEHHRFLTELQGAFPDSPFVFTMRDPRDTVMSIRRVFNTSIEGAAYRWREAFENYRAHAARVHLLRYEVLVQNPVAEVRALCAFLGERFELQMLEFHRHTGDEFKRLGGEKLSSAIDASSLGGFRSMPESELRVIEAVCGEGMEALGYAFVARRWTTPRLARHSRWRWIIDRLRYYGFTSRRWRRGLVGWKVMARARLRWVLNRGDRA